MFTPRNIEERVAESYSPGVKIEPYSYSDRIPSTIYPPEGYDDLEGVVIPMNPGVKLYDFQMHGVLAIARRGNVLLADEQGAGKTAQVIHAINYLDLKRVLVICPPSLIFNWEQEFVDFLTRRDAHVVSFAPVKKPGDEDKKDKTISGVKLYQRRTLTFTEGEAERTTCSSQNNPRFDILIVGDSSFQKTKSAGNLLDIIRSTKFDMVVIDEAHRFKNPDAARTRAIIGSMPDPETGNIDYKGVIREIPRKVFISGTPLVNAKLSEFYHLLATLDKRSFGNFALFESRYQSKAKNQGGKVVIETKNDRFLAIQLRESVMIRRLLRDVLTLPPMSCRAVGLADTPEIERAREALQSAIAEAIASGELKIDTSRGRSIEEIIGEIINDPDSSTMEETEEVSALRQGLEDALADPSITADERISLTIELNKIYERAELQQASGEQKIPFTLISTMRRTLAEAKCMAAPAAIYKYIMDLHERKLFNGKCVIFYHHQTGRNILMQGLIKVFAEEPVKHGRPPIVLTPDSFEFMDGNNTKLVWNKTAKKYDMIPYTQTPQVRQAAVRRFQKNKNVKFFLSSIETGGTGITLTAANTLIFAEQDWTPAKMQQAMYRIYRIGQTATSVNTGVLYVRDSIDANIASKLILKRHFQKQILDSVPSEQNMEIYRREYSLTDAARGGKYSAEVRASFRQVIERLRRAFFLWTNSRMEIPFNNYTNLIGSSQRRMNVVDEFSPPQTVRAFLGEGRERPYGYGAARPGVIAIRSLERAYQSLPNINSTTWDESIIDELMPLMWACRGWKCNKLVPHQRQPMLVIEAPMLSEIPFPPELTGVLGGESAYSPMEFATRLSFLKIVNAASAPGRRNMRNQRLAEKRRRAAEAAIEGAKEAEDESDDTDL